MSLLEHPAVKRVQAALEQAGSAARVVALGSSARTAEEAAASLGVPLGAIVKSLVFSLDGEPVMALVAGDKTCDTRGLKRALGRQGVIARADAEMVRRATGFAIGGVAPVGHSAPLPTVIDDSLQRFDTVYAAAGHPHCVFPTTVWELSMITGAPVVRGISSD